MEGRPLKTVYLGRMPEVKKATLGEMLVAEFNAVISERPDLDVCFASDGAPQHWILLDQMKASLPEAMRARSMSLVDAFHVAEYLQAAADAAKGAGPEARILATEWREMVKELDDGPDKVLVAMRYQRSKLKGARRKELDKAIGYIANQRAADRMRYAEALSRKLPIGTGVTEAAAKTVVGVRMKRAGARYSQHGGQTILLFRTAVLSGRFDSLSRQLEVTYTAKVYPLKSAA